MACCGDAAGLFFSIWVCFPKRNAPFFRITSVLLGRNWGGILDLGVFLGRNAAEFRIWACCSKRNAPDFGVEACFSGRDALFFGIEGPFPPKRIPAREIENDLPTGIH